jgi:hypothetical protein
MRRRRLLANALLAVLAPPALTPVGGCTLPRPPRTDDDALVRRPAQQLALTLADLPPGFHLGEELSAPGPARGTSDPLGVVSAYSVTFTFVAEVDGVDGVDGADGLDKVGESPRALVKARRPARPAPAPGVGDVVSSVNAYAGTGPARSAFAAWQAAVPGQYTPVQAHSGGAAAGNAGAAGLSVYVQVPRAACLVGFRAHNVVASVWASAGSGAAAPPIDVATRLARLVAHRIEAVAGR